MRKISSFPCHRFYRASSSVSRIGGMNADEFRKAAHAAIEESRLVYATGVQDWEG